MITLLLAVGTLMALVGMLLFQASLLPGILAMLFGILGLAAVLAGKRKPAGVFRVVPGLSLLICVGCLWTAQPRVQQGGIFDYRRQMEKAAEQIEDGRLDAAAATIQSLEENYGEDDNTRILAALENLKTQNVQSAQEKLQKVNDKTSMLYYAVLEQVYLASDSFDAAQALYELYPEAAAQWPDWCYMQKYAGIAGFEQGRYQSSLYYLKRAYAQDNGDAATCYYLGAVSYRMGDLQSAVDYFQEALKKGADEELQRDIRWYVDQIRKLQESEEKA